MSDEYVPLVLKISRFGDVSVSKDTQMDISSDQQGQPQLPAEDEEEDGV